MTHPEADDNGHQPPLRVVFFGLYTPLQGAPTIGEAIAELRGANVRWTMIGQGQDRAATEAAAGDAEVTWLDWVDYDDLPALVAEHDVCLGIFGRTPKGQRVVPNKVFQGAAAGCAVITSDTPPQRDALGEAAIYVPPGDAGALARAIAGLAADRTELERMRRAAHDAAVERFRPATVTRSLSKALPSARAAATRTTADAPAIAAPRTAGATGPVAPDTGPTGPVPTEPTPTARTAADGAGWDGGAGRGALRRLRWRAIVTIAGLVGLAIAVATTVDDVGEQALPAPAPLLGAFLLQVLALGCAARSWTALFPAGADRSGLARGLYASQLTKYLPVGGLAQATSQVALASTDGGVMAAAVRLPVFALCSVLAGATCSALLALDGDLPLWARALAVLGPSTLVVADRRVLQAVLRLARRFVPRLPPPEQLPGQRAILTSYGYALGNMVAFAAAFTLLLGDLTDVDPWRAAPAVTAAWVVGYLAIPIPSGLGVREAMLLALLPTLATGPLLAASVAHRLVGLLAEALLAGATSGQAVLARRHGQPTQPERPARTDA